MSDRNRALKVTDLVHDFDMSYYSQSKDAAEKYGLDSFKAKSSKNHSKKPTQSSFMSTYGQQHIRWNSALGNYEAAENLKIEE